MNARTLYQSAQERITFAYNFLTVHQCGNEWSIAIGPLGLIDLGLELCAIARGYGVDANVYSHPDGVFHVEYDNEDVIFTEGSRFAMVNMGDKALLDFGLELIECGYSDISAGREALFFENCYGGHVTQTEAAA